VTTRDEIAAAASTVDGVDVSPLYRAVSGVGQGYVEWLRTEYPNTLGGEDYWGVVIVLPQDLAAAQAWIADHKRDLWDALGYAMVVTQARPELVLFPDNQSQKTLVLEGHREAEE
jgi:hypothetical protein